MNRSDILKAINEQLNQEQNRSLNTIEMLILQGVWEDKTYHQMALEEDYSPGYLTNVVAPEMYRKLSNLLGQRVTKKNCRQMLESYATTQSRSERQAVKLSVTPEQKNGLFYPNGSLPLNSPYYLKRSCIEDLVCQEITKPGSFVRLKAPREMGKTSLLLRVLDYAERQGYQTVSLSLDQVDTAILGNLNQFLRWLCANISRQLDIKPRLNEYWSQDLGSKISCNAYIQDYVLRLMDTPLVLAIDEVSLILDNSGVAKDFFLLLRSWYEEAKKVPVWRKLRLIVVQSTEMYFPLRLNQSPFNVGLLVYLKPFNQEEVQRLAQCYGLYWENDNQVKSLMEMVGGHPALVHLTIYHLSHQKMTLEQIQETAIAPTGIFYYHLQRHQITLEQQPPLAAAFKTVISANQPIKIDDSILVYKLNSLGLVQQRGDKVTVFCKLYQRYFGEML